MSQIQNSSLPFNDNATNGNVVDQTDWNQFMQTLQAAINDNYSLIQDLNPNKSIPSMASPPTNNNWVVGQVVWNSSPVKGGNVGWVCTTSGTPGTWTPFGLISTI